MSQPIMKSINSNANLIVKSKIAPVIENKTHNIMHTEQEISTLRKMAIMTLKK